MLKERARLFANGLLLGELGIWTLSFVAAHAIRSSLTEPYGPIQPLPMHLPLLGAALAGWWAFRRLTGNERSRRTSPITDEIFGVAGATAILTVLVMVAIFVLKWPANSRLFVATFGTVAGTSLIVVRLAIRLSLRWARRHGYNTRALAIVGEGEGPRRMGELLREHPEWGYHLAGVVQVGDEPPALGPVLGRLSEIADILADNVLDEVIFAVGRLDLARFEDALAACDEAGVNSRIVLDFFPHKVSRMQLEELDGLPVLGFVTTRSAGAALVAKRAFDIVVSSLALVLGAPVFLALALAVRLTSDGPILFVQRRVGLQGRDFDLVKFRSMVAGAETQQQALLSQNEADGPTFKMREDPRVTPFGRFLRRTSLDEIPQFFNVLRGEMSVVGPRPPLPSEVVRYERWQRRRLSMKPGLTCIWQVSGRHRVDFDTWMRQDLAYIDNWSLWLDLRIVIRTIPAVLFPQAL